MSVLIVSDICPTLVRNSAVFRFSKLIGIYREGRAVFFCDLGEQRQIEKIGAEQIACSRVTLLDAGAQVLDCASAAHCRPASTARCCSSGIRRPAVLRRSGRDAAWQLLYMEFRKYLLPRFGDCPNEVRHLRSGR